MESELLKKLLIDPAHWPFIFLLAVAIIFANKVVNVIAEAVARHVSAQAKSKKGLLIIAKFVGQIVLVAIVIYIANATYWAHAIREVLPPHTKKPINACTATVELFVERSEDTTHHFIDRGGYLAFCKQDQAILMVAAPDSWGRPTGTNEYVYRGVFSLDATHEAVGKPVDFLREAEYVQVMFHKLPENAELIRGRAVCVINNELRCELTFPAQKADGTKVFLRDMTVLRKVLE